MTGTDHFADVNGLRLHYRTHGDPTAPPLVLLHGVTMEARSWDRLAGAIGDSHHILALTARGHGDSAHAAEYGVMQHISDTAAFIDQCAGGSAIVCGLSMGGNTAIGLAAIHPAKVSKLIIVEVGAVEPAGLARLADGFARSPESWATYEDALVTFRAGYLGVPDDVLLAYMPHVLRSGADGRIRAKLDPQLAATRTYSEEDQAQAEQLLWAACAAIKCPTLIVRGTHSDIFSHEGATRTAAAITGTRLTEVEAAHVIPLENPTALHHAIRDFI